MPEKTGPDDTDREFVAPPTDNKDGNQKMAIDGTPESAQATEPKAKLEQVMSSEQKIICHINDIEDSHINTLNSPG